MTFRHGRHGIHVQSRGNLGLTGPPKQKTDLLADNCILKGGKGGSVEERFCKKASPYSKFEFSFPVSLCLPFKELFFSVFQ